MKKAFGAITVLLMIAFFHSCGNQPKDSVSVVTFNMYVGLGVEESRLDEIIGGADPVPVAQEIFDSFLATDAEERISLMAREFSELKPDFIALQEVTEFSVFPVFSVDFLSLLLEEIKKAGGPDYKSISVTNIEEDLTFESGGFPVIIHFSDSEAILYKKEFRVEEDYVSKHLAAYREPVEYEGRQIIFYRSVLGGRFSYAGEQLMSLFTTHLDQVYVPDDVQKNQMAEAVSTASEYAGDDNLVLVGDFNSEEGDETYELAPSAGFTDTFRELNPVDDGFTCCNAGDLANLTPLANEKIDLIFAQSSKWVPVESKIILNTRSSIWPSDHFGVMTIFERVLPTK